MSQTNAGLGQEQSSQGPENTRGSNYLAPRVDIYEGERELVIFAEMPGVRREDINIQFERGELVLQGRAPARTRAGNVLAREYEVGDFYRVFQIQERSEEHTS